MIERVLVGVESWKELSTQTVPMLLPSLIAQGGMFDVHLDKALRPEAVIILYVDGSVEVLR